MPSTRVLALLVFIGCLVSSSAFAYNTSFKYCFAPTNPFFEAASRNGPSGAAFVPKVAAADMALFVVGLNHNDWDHQNADAAGVEAIAERIHDVWADADRLVIAISETGGCSNCGWATSPFETGSAHTLANKLSSLYNHKFQVKRAISEGVFSYTSMPAIITGGTWRAPQENFIGRFYPVKLKSKLDRYAEVSLVGRGAVVSFSIVHLEPGWVDDHGFGAHERKLQMMSIMYDRTSDVSFLLGDFNVTLNDLQDKQRDDQLWEDRLLKSAVWATRWLPCSYIGKGQFRQAHMFNDIVNIAELAKRKRNFRLRPVAYLFDIDGAGLPAYAQDPLAIDMPMKAHGIMHTMLGVLFVAEGSPSGIGNTRTGDAKPRCVTGMYWCEKCGYCVTIAQGCHCIAK